MGLTKAYEASGTQVANGAGTAAVTLNGPGTGWVDVDSIAVQTTPGIPIPSAIAYEGTIAALGRVLAILRAADVGTFRGTGDRLVAGQQITIVFSGAAPGATCRAILRGTEHAL